MNIGMKKVFLITITALFSFLAQAQDRYQLIDKNLQLLAQTNTGLNESVELSVNTAPLGEFIRGLGLAHALNIAVDNSITGTVTNNFASARVSDVLLFLCKQHELDIQFVGTIISVVKYKQPEVKNIIISRTPQVEYNEQADFLSLELKNDTLDKVAEVITTKSGKNVILAPDVKGKLINVFIRNRPFDSTLDKMALSNGLKITKTSDSFYYIERDEQVASNPDATTKKTNPKEPNQKPVEKDLKLVIDNGKISSFSADNANILDVIDAVSRELYKNYFLYNEIKGTTSLFVENVTFDQFLAYVLNSTEYTFKIQEGIYLIGSKKLEGLRTTELIQLNNRTVETVLDVIPAELKEGVEIKEFVELNGLIATASYDDILALKDFISQIDQVVPMVIIEVIIMDVKKFVVVSTGLSMGIGTPPASSTGTITPGLDVSLSTDAINNIISGINGFGLLNLGNVTPNFYMNLKALEENGNINIRSTPKLSTLNGHEASMKVGNTEYYLEIANNVIGSQNPQNIITQTYKSVNADLSITIKPTVSSDEQVTLEIEVEQSDFTGRISPNAPPGSVTRKFKSVVRAKNGDMILLGGLEEKNNNETYSGLPGIAKIPVLRWFFGIRNVDKSKSKLSIFIKPTIIY
jgi:type IV pilus assembly protein PilQ